MLCPGDRFDRLLDRAVIEDAERRRAAERSAQAQETALATIRLLTQMMLEVGYLVEK